MRKSCVAVAVALCLVAGVAQAGENLQIGAMPLGSIWYVFAASFAKLGDTIAATVPSGSQAMARPFWILSTLAG